jgi:hypothetical protein
LNFS